MHDVKTLPEDDEHGMAKTFIQGSAHALQLYYRYILLV